MKSCTLVPSEMLKNKVLNDVHPLAYSSTFDVILILYKERALDKHSFLLSPFGRIVK